MYSLLKPSLVYEDISSDITEQDEDHDASEWVYSEKTVYRGAIDTQYISHGLDVYSLYNEESERIGIAEHLSDNRAEFKVLWFSDNPWNTLFQEEWNQGLSIYSKLSPEAYQDSTDLDLLLIGNERLVLPKYIYKGFPDIYECKCSLSFSKTKSCQSKKKVLIEPIFIDDSFIIYYPPSNSKVWSKLGLQQPVSSVEEEQTHQQDQPELLVETQELQQSP
jgi:hypothetical protein